jgi:hypothetical protein
LMIVQEIRVESFRQLIRNSWKGIIHSLLFQSFVVNTSMGRSPFEKTLVFRNSSDNDR